VVSSVGPEVPKRKKKDTKIEQVKPKNKRQKSKRRSNVKIEVVSGKMRRCESRKEETTF
jgi:hypothetical protein